MDFNYILELEYNQNVQTMVIFHNYSNAKNKMVALIGSLQTAIASFIERECHFLSLFTIIKRLL